MVNKVDVFVHYQNHLRYFVLHILHFFKDRTNFKMHIAFTLHTLKMKNAQKFKRIPMQGRYNERTYCKYVLYNNIFDANFRPTNNTYVPTYLIAWSMQCFLFWLHLMVLINSSVMIMKHLFSFGKDVYH